MVKFSIICLIYRSTSLADWVWYSAHKYTPMLRTGEAEFLFVANDPEDYVVKHLIDKKYQFIINHNRHYSEDELFARGYGIPEHMNRVYKGYNQGILHAKGERLVLINSDNFFSPDWLENLIKYSDFKKIIVSQLVERKHPKFGVFPGALEKDFGSTVENFQEENFIEYTYKTNKTGLKKSGAYMPCLIYKDIAMYAGLYPEGNIAGDTKEQIVRYGDERFYDKLKTMGVDHYTALDSIVYHLKEGEREEGIERPEISPAEYKQYDVTAYSELPVEKYTKLGVDLAPTANHAKIINALLDDSPQNFNKKQLTLFQKLFSKHKVENKRIIYFMGLRFSYKKKKERR